MGLKYVRCDEGVGSVHGRARLQRVGEELHQGNRTAVGPKQVPAPVNDDGGEGFLPREHAVELLSDFSKALA